MKQIKKESKPAITKKLDINEEKKKIIEHIKFSDHPDNVVSEFTKLLEIYDKNPTQKNKEKLDEASLRVSMTIGLDTHIPLIYAVNDEYRSTAFEFADQLNKEFNVTASSEKALVQTIVVSYVRIMVLSRQLTSTLRLGTTSQNINAFYTTVSKDLDRAHRQFTSSLCLLKELKSPALKVNIKTNTAFVAQNQQIVDNKNPCIGI